MRTFYWVSGELTEVQRFINVPMRWCEQYRARERRELWITTDAACELKFIVHTRYLPARRGHRVAVLVWQRQVAALLNLTTGEGINFYRSDPPLLWKRCDGAALIAGALAAALAAVAHGRPEWLLVLPLLACAALTLLLGRWAHRALACRAIRRLLQQASEPAARRARFRRVR
jgi:hypothetical protein